MSTFTYRVTVEVEDDLGGPTECYDPQYHDWCVVDHDEAGHVTSAFIYPDDKANLIMETHLDSLEKDLRSAIGDYEIEWTLER